MGDSLELIVGRIEGRLTGIEGKLDANLAAHSDSIKQLDARVTVVEKWQWKAAGVLALIAFIVPILVKVIL